MRAPVLFIVFLLSLLLLPLTSAADLAQCQANAADSGYPYTSADGDTSAVSANELTAFRDWFNSNQLTSSTPMPALYGFVDDMRQAGYGFLFVTTPNPTSEQPTDNCAGGCGRVLTVSGNGPVSMSFGAAFASGTSYTNMLDSFQNTPGVVQFMVSLDDIQKLPQLKDNGGLTCPVHLFVADNTLYTTNSPNNKIWARIIDLGGVIPPPPQPQDEQQYSIESPPDGDPSSAACTALGQSWDNNGRCCGDDGADHGSSVANFFSSYSPRDTCQDFSANYQGAATIDCSASPDPPMDTVNTGDYTIDGAPRICNTRSVGTFGWNLASTSAGQIIEIRDSEYVSDGAAWRKGSTSCQIVPSVVPTGPVENIYVAATELTAQPYEKNHWLQCAGPNLVVDGGVNKVLGDRVLCGGQNYVCAKNSQTNVNQWVPEDDFRSNVDYAASCNTVGAGGGDRISFVWTGTHCCYGGQNYEDPTAAELIDTPGFENPGVCLFGRAYPRDLPAAFDKNIPSYVASFGKLLSCAANGNEAFARKTNYCATVNETRQFLPGSTEENPILTCTYNGVWDEAPEGATEGLVLTTVPDGGNLLRNPSFAGDAQ